MPSPPSWCEPRLVVTAAPAFRRSARADGGAGGEPPAEAARFPELGGADGDRGLARRATARDVVAALPNEDEDEDEDEEE